MGGSRQPGLAWAQDGGTDKLIARLKDPKERARIRKEMENTNPSWESRYQSAGTWQNVQLAAIGRTQYPVGIDTVW